MADEELLNKLKDIVRCKLIVVYEKRGLQASLNMADEYLKDAAKVGKQYDIDDFGKILRGELSEIYAELCLREYVKYHKNSFYVKSLCFKRTDGKPGYTELDLTLFTDKFVLLVECKSYSGKKNLTDEGCMNVKGRTSYNVFTQSRMHLANLDPYIRKCRLKTLRDGGKPYMLCMFSYSRDPIEDLRQPEWKNKFKLLTEENMVNYLDSISKEDKIWDIRKLHSTVMEMHKHSARNKEKHIALSKKKQANS